MNPLKRWSGLTGFVGLVSAIAFFLITYYINSKSISNRDLLVSFAILVITGLIALYLQGEEVRASAEMRAELMAGISRSFVEELASEASKLQKNLRIKRILPTQTALVMSQKDKMLRDLVDRMRRLAEEGRFETPYWSCDLLLKQVSGMKSFLLGVSPWPEDKEWWKSSSGRNFWEANEQAIKLKKGKITRIFRCSASVSDPLSDEGLLSEMKRHDDIGVEVYYIRESEATGILQEAYAVIDDVIAFQGYTPTEERRDRNIFWVGDEAVRQLKQKLERVLRLATRYEPQSK